MKQKHEVLGELIAVAAIFGVVAPTTAAAVGTAFSYQGLVAIEGVPYDGACDFELRLYDSPTRATVLATHLDEDIAVDAGVFHLQVDFGDSFDGNERWLEIDARCPAGRGGSFATLAPRQRISATPYALYANEAGTLATPVDQPITLSVGGVTALAITPGDPPNIVLGGGNLLAANVVGATLSGGSRNSVSASYGTIGGGGPYNLDPNQPSPDAIANRVTDIFGTVGGGAGNLAGDEEGTRADAAYATVGGGLFNDAKNEYATVSGGQSNDATGPSATIGGGSLNDASGSHATIAGGYAGDATEAYSTVGGGYFNRALGEYATVPGGSENQAIGRASLAAGERCRADGDHSFALGNRASVTHDGSFVWADADDNPTGGSEFPFFSRADNEFAIRARNGLRIRALGDHHIILEKHDFGTDDDGVIISDPRYPSSDLIFRSNDNFRIDIDENDDQQDSSFHIVAANENRVFSVDETGDVRADGRFVCGASSNCFSAGGGADLAEHIDGDLGLEPGDLVEIDPDGIDRYRLASAAFSSLVAGVLSTRPAITMNNGNAADGGLDPRPMLALVGKVPVKAVADNGPIRPGDLLVSAAIPGHVMRAGDAPPIGTVVGKALSPLPDERGQVLMLVMLR